MSFPIVDRGSMGARHTTAASSGGLTLASAALNTRGFVADVLDDADVARQRVLAMIPEGADVFTAASETLRLSGIDAELNDSARYESVRNRTSSMDRAAQASEIRRHMATPEFAIGSVAAVTVDGTLVVVSASGSQLPAYAGGAARLVLVVGAQKVVSDLAAAFRRIEEHALPLEVERARRAYGRESAANKLLVLAREPFPGRTIVFLLRQAIGF